MENACESGALRKVDKHCTAWRFASDRWIDAVDSHDPSDEMKKAGAVAHHLAQQSRPPMIKDPA